MLMIISIGVRIACPAIPRPMAKKKIFTILFVTEFSV
jgi:hypothetical protein